MNTLKPFQLPSIDVSESAENETSLFILSSEGILFGYYKDPQIGYSLNKIKENIRIRNLVTSNRTVPIIQNISNIKGASLEVLRFMSTPEYLHNINRIAIVLESPFHRMLFKIYAKLKGGAIDIRAFKSVDIAYKWTKSRM